MQIRKKYLSKLHFITDQSSFDTEQKTFHIEHLISSSWISSYKYDLINDNK